MRTRLLFLLALLCAFTSYGQNQRAASFTATTGMTTAVMRATGPATATGGLTSSGGSTNSGGGVRNTTWTEQTAGVTNRSATATRQDAPLLVNGGFALSPKLIATVGTVLQDTNVYQWWTTNADFTVLFGGTPIDGARGQFDIKNTAATNITVTWPSSWNIAQAALITTLTAISNAITEVFWYYEGGSNRVRVATKEIIENFTAPTAGQLVGFHDPNTKTNFTVGTLTDGDKGDITVASSGAAWSIDDNVVTGAKIALASQAAGDVMYYDGTDWIRLAKGTAGQVLEMNAGATAPEWDTDDNTGSNTLLNDIGDASADGVVAMAGFRMSYTSTLNGGVVNTVTNSVADITSDTFLFELAYLDNADANAGFYKYSHNAGASIAESLTSTIKAVNVPATNSSTFLVSGAAGFGSTITAAGAVILQSANDPDITVEGSLTWDANGDVLRGFDGTAQVAVGRKIEAIHVTVVSPNDLADSERDAFWIWENVSGMSFIVTGWSAKSDTDNTTLNIEEIDNDGANNATVDAVEIATDGTGLFYASDSTITAATIENGHLLLLDFDDTDTPGQVKVTIFGYYDANVN